MLTLKEAIEIAKKHIPKFEYLEQEREKLWSLIRGYKKLELKGD